MHKFSKYFVISLIALCLIFIFQNMETVHVSFLFWDLSMPRAALICLMLVIGFIIGFFLNGARKMLSKQDD